LRTALLSLAALPATARMQVGQAISPPRGAAGPQGTEECEFVL